MDTFNQVKDIVAASTGLGEDEITPTSTIDNLHLDSLTLIDIAVRLEDHFGRRMDDEEINSIHSIQDMIDLVQSSHKE